MTDVPPRCPAVHALLYPADDSGVSDSLVRVHNGAVCHATVGVSV